MRDEGATGLGYVYRQHYNLIRSLIYLYILNASNFLTCLAVAGEIGSIFQIHDSMREIVLPFRIYFKSNLPESFLISSCLTTVQS